MAAPDFRNRDAHRACMYAEGNAEEALSINRSNTAWSVQLVEIDDGRSWLTSYSVC
jgi:hypothetical protein